MTNPGDLRGQSGMGQCLEIDGYRLGRMVGGMIQFAPPVGEQPLKESAARGRHGITVLIFLARFECWPGRGVVDDGEFIRMYEQWNQNQTKSTQAHPDQVRKSKHSQSPLH